MGRVKQLQRQLGTSGHHANERLLDLASRRRAADQKTEEQRANEVPDVERPAGIPESFDEHAHCSMTYSCSRIRRIYARHHLHTGREQSPRRLPQIGVPEPHHAMTHHQNDPAKMEKCVKIQRYPPEAVRGLSGETAEHA
jgi:hypothetical protein